MRNCLFQAISPFPTVFSKGSYCRQGGIQNLFGKELNSLHKQQILDCSKLKKSSDGNCKFDENGDKFSQKGGKQ